MTFAEFHAGVRAVAASRYCSSQIEATTSRDGETVVVFKAYIDGLSWTRDHYDPAQCLADLRGEIPKQDADAVIAAAGEVSP